VGEKREKYLLVNKFLNRKVSKKKEFSREKKKRGTTLDRGRKVHSLQTSSEKKEKKRSRRKVPHRDQARGERREGTPFLKEG